MDAKEALERSQYYVQGTMAVQELRRTILWDGYKYLQHPVDEIVNKNLT